MKIKTFYSKSMAEALREVKSSLGPDALILSSKEIRRRTGVWGQASGFEVVAAADDAEGLDSFASADAAPAAAAGTYTPAGLLAGPVAPAAPKARFKGRIPTAIYEDLVGCGVEETLARDLLEHALAKVPPARRRSRAAMIKSLTGAALERVAGTSGENGMPGKKVVAFVGPTGVGKTTSIAKLAAFLALKKRKKVLLMTLDGYRIGAIEQLRSYAGLMGIPFRYIGRVDELGAALSENAQRDYILIDTAGRGPKDIDSMKGLAAFLRQSDFIERHLVLSITTRQSDLRKITDRFEICGPDHLLFTKLDETSAPGPILNELVRTQKSFAYYSDGQRVPDDLHAVPRERLLEIILNTAKERYL